MKKYYKIITPYLYADSDYVGRSVNINLPSNYIVNYKLNEWIKPVQEGTRLYVFDTIENAERFINLELTSGRETLYKCEVINPRKDLVAIPYYITKYWELIKQARKSHKKINLSLLQKKEIPGTYSCSALKLLDVVGNYVKGYKV